MTPKTYGLLHRPARRNVETRTLGAAELPFNGVPQILQQVEAVGHLPSLWRPSGGALGGALCVQTAAGHGSPF